MKLSDRQREFLEALEFAGPRGLTEFELRRLMNYPGPGVSGTLKALEVRGLARSVNPGLLRYTSHMLRWVRTEVER